jgi:hypothetical protein
MKILKTEKLNYPRYAEVGDSIRVLFTDELGNSHQLAEQPITQRQKIDTVIIFEISPGEYGLKSGFGAVFGESE